MKLYLLTQYVNNEYDTYDSIVVAAPSKRAAIRIHPGVAGMREWDDKKSSWMFVCMDGSRLEEDSLSWVTLPDIECKYLGVAGKNVKKGVIVASFNAG